MGVLDNGTVLLHCPGNGTRDSGRCGASKFGSAAIFYSRPPTHGCRPSAGESGQKPDCISCMPVQLKDNHRIVIIVTGVAVVSVAREKCESAPFLYGPHWSCQFPVPGSWILRDFELSAVFETLHCPGMGTRDSGRCGASKFGSAAIFYSRPPTHGCRPSAGESGQKPDCISCMPVQLKDNHRIVIIVTGVAVVSVAREKI